MGETAGVVERAQGVAQRLEQEGLRLFHPRAGSARAR